MYANALATAKAITIRMLADNPTQWMSFRNLSLSCLRRYSVPKRNEGPITISDEIAPIHHSLSGKINWKLHIKIAIAAPISPR